MMKKQKILIIDDSKLNREILANMLGDYYEIDEAENGAQALEILTLRREEFSLILLDLKMPFMDGYEVLKAMKDRQWLDVHCLLSAFLQRRRERVSVTLMIWEPAITLPDHLTPLLCSTACRIRSHSVAAIEQNRNATLDYLRDAGI